MIKFFRKIRYDLMEKNKTGKYLKYAIGEIVLVVIGILIALSINNWNEHQKILNNEEELIISLKEEVTNTIIEIEASLVENNLFLKSADELINKLSLNDDVLNMNEIYAAFNYRGCKINSPVLEGIIATNSNVLVNRKEQITDLRLLKNGYDNVVRQEYYLEEIWNRKIVDFMIDCGLYVKRNAVKINLFSIEDLERSGYSKDQFIALLNIKIRLHIIFKEAQEKAIKKSKQVLNILDN